MASKIKTISRELYEYLDDCFIKYRKREKEAQEKYYSDNSRKVNHYQLINDFKELYYSGVFKYLGYDGTEAVFKAIKKYKFEDVYDEFARLFYELSYDFDDAVLDTITGIIFDDFIEENKYRFEELANEMNAIGNVNKDVQSESTLNYESFRRRKRR